MQGSCKPSDTLKLHKGFPNALGSEIGHPIGCPGFRGSSNLLGRNGYGRINAVWGYLVGIEWIDKPLLLVQLKYTSTMGWGLRSCDLYYLNMLRHQRTWMT